MAGTKERPKKFKKSHPKRCSSSSNAHRESHLSFSYFSSFFVSSIGYWNSSASLFSCDILGSNLEVKVWQRVSWLVNLNKYLFVSRDVRRILSKLKMELIVRLVELITAWNKMKIIGVLRTRFMLMFFVVMSKGAFVKFIRSYLFFLPVINV